MNDLLPEISGLIQRLALPVGLGIAVALTVAAYKVIMGVKAKFDAVAGETNARTFWQAIAFAVQSAEQSGLIAKVKLVAAEKKRMAIDFAEGQLKLHGLNVDLDIIADAIEAAVANKWQELVMLPDGQLLHNGDATPVLSKDLTATIKTAKAWQVNNAK